MNALTKIERPADLSTLLDRVATMEANCKRNARIRARADEIVSKHTPERTDRSHPLHNPAGFMERCQYRANRNRLLRMAETELRCLDYAMEYWQHDYDAAVVNLTTPSPSFRAETRLLSLSDKALAA